MAASCCGHPESVRLLVKYGADVAYAYSGDNANCVYMMAYHLVHLYREDAEELEALLEERSARFVRTLDLLLGYGAAPDQPSASSDADNERTALSLLEATHIDENLPKTREEFASLIALLRKNFWPCSPQPLQCATAEEIQALILAGAVCDPSTHCVSAVRMRSIDPDARPGVLLRLRMQEEERAAFVGIVLPAACLARPRGSAYLCSLDSPLLQLIADFAEVPYGRALRNLREAIRILDSFDMDDKRQQDDEADDDDDEDDGEEEEEDDEDDEDDQDKDEDEDEED